MDATWYDLRGLTPQNPYSVTTNPRVFAVAIAAMAVFFLVLLLRLSSDVASDPSPAGWALVAVAAALMVYALVLLMGPGVTRFRTGPAEYLQARSDGLVIRYARGQELRWTWGAVRGKTMLFDYAPGEDPGRARQMLWVHDLSTVQILTLQAWSPGHDVSARLSRTAFEGILGTWRAAGLTVERQRLPRFRGIEGSWDIYRIPSGPPALVSS